MAIGADQQTIDGAAAAAEGWATDPKGRQYIRRPEGHGQGLIWRKEGESVEDAVARDRIVVLTRQATKQSKRAAGDSRPRGKGRKPDPTPPGANPKPKVKVERPSAEQLASALEIPLMAPMLFARLVWQCDFCAQNFKANAPAAARDLTDYAIASNNEYLLRLLTTWQHICAAFLGARGMEGLMRYAVPPALHHVAPEPVLAFAGPMLGVPPRPAPAHSHNRPGPRHAETRGEQAPGTAPGPGANPAPGPGAAPAPGPIGPETMEARRAQQINEMAARQAREAELAAQLAAEQMARRGAQPNIPPYDARRESNGRPETPSVAADPGAAGSPLPPEATSE